MGKAIGLFGCTAVVAAALWLANDRQTTRTASAQEEFDPRTGAPMLGSGPRTSAGELLRRGMSLYLEGRHAQAVQSLEAAREQQHQLSEAERRRLAEYLQLAKNEQRRAAAPPTLAPPGGALPAASGETTRARIAEYMRRAQLEHGSGNSLQAIRWAATADSIAHSAGIDFPPEQETPNEFIARVRGAGSPAPASPGIPVEPAPATRIAQSPAGEPGPDSAYPVSQEGREARRMMAEARAAFNAGNYDEARRLAEQASALESSWKLFEENPAQLIADVERATGLIQFPRRSPDPAGQPVVQAPMAEQPANVSAIAPRGDVPASAEPRYDNPVAGGAALPKIQPAASAEALHGPDYAKARDLLQQARQDLAEGRIDSAQAKVQAADQLNVTYGVFDDRPEIVFQDIERVASQTSHIARRRATTQQASPAAAESPEKQQARLLVNEARRAVQEGRLDDAQRLVAQAAQLPVTYGIFEDTPEQVQYAIEQVAQSQRPAPEQNVAFDEPQPENGGFVTPAPQPENVGFVTPEPQPENVGFVTPAAEPAYDPGFESQPPPFAQADTVQPAVGTNDPRWETPVRTQPVDYSPARLDVVRPRGPSAAELFNEGLAQLQAGRNDLAYESFLSAYQSGQQLDAYRMQQLQDFLRDLRPRRSEPRQVADASQAGQPVAPRGAAAGAGALFEVEQQRAVQYDRLRTETLNAIFKADRLREKDPQQALEIIDRATASISASDFDEQTVAPLVSQLGRTRQSIETWQQQRAPILELEDRNEEVLDIVRRERETEIRVEQEVAALVEQFNELFSQRRYAEAEVVAKQARDLDQDNPVTEVLFWKARYARRIDSNDQLREVKEEAIWKMFDDVEQAAIPATSDYSFGRDWAEINRRRRGKYGPDTRERTEEEQQIEQSLSRRISLNFEKAPLSEVMKHIATIADVNVALDKMGLEEEGVSTDQEVTIHVDGIMLKSALNLMLKPLHLGYTIEDEVLKVTSSMRQQGALEVRNYSVADLVSPIPNFVPSGGTAMTSSGTSHNQSPGFGGHVVVPAMGGRQNAAGAQFQVADPAIPGAPVHTPWSGAGVRSELGSSPASSVEFDTLMELIVSTIEPDTWAEMGGPGSIRPYETTLSLVIRQTGSVHEEIADLLQQLRRLQDLQVTIEVRFISVADRFFEAIGVDFDFDVQDNVEADTAFTPTLPAFGTPGGLGVTGDPIDGDPNPPPTGSFFPIPGLNLPDLDEWPKTGTVVGLADDDGSFTPDLDVAFRQGSFDIGIPDFGGFAPEAGVQVGMAILTDIEAFFFIRAAQGDERTNIMFAPKVTLFNGQLATVSDVTQRPFVTSLVPTVGFGAVGFTPQITVLSEGVTMSVLAVISADRRFVRLTVIPFFSSITDVFTFTFQQGAGQQGAGVQGQGQGGQLGQGGGQGGFQPISGFGGIGGGEMARNALMLALPGQQQVVTEAPTVTIQQPVFEFVSVTTTVSVPDGGTVLLGGVKRLREGRNMSGVPILNKLPYISRLFKNTGVGRDTESLMLMVTPRIIIQEEEEELLGIDLD